MLERSRQSTFPISMYTKHDAGASYRLAWVVRTLDDSLQMN